MTMSVQRKAEAWGLAQDGHGGGLGGDAGRLYFVSSSKDGHTGGGVVVFVGTEMGEAEKSRRGERESAGGRRKVHAACRGDLMWAHVGCHGNPQKQAALCGLLHAPATSVTALADAGRAARTRPTCNPARGRPRAATSPLLLPEPSRTPQLPGPAPVYKQTPPRLIPAAQRANHQSIDPQANRKRRTALDFEIALRHTPRI